MTTKEEVIRYCLTLPGAYEDYPFDPFTPCMRHRDNHRIFALIMEREGHIQVNVKCSPEWILFWREAFEAVIPGFHMNKKHWNTIILNGTVPEKDICRMIAESYDLTGSAVKGKKKRPSGGEAQDGSAGSGKGGAG